MAMKVACGNGFPLNIPSEIPTGGGGGASSADDVSYDNSLSGLTADNVQAAIDEVAELIPNGEHSPYINKEGSKTYDDILKSVLNSIDGSKLNLNSKLIFEDVGTNNRVLILPLVRIEYANNAFVSFTASQVGIGNSTDITRVTRIFARGGGNYNRAVFINLANNSITSNDKINSEFDWNRAYIMY